MMDKRIDEIEPVKPPRQATSFVTGLANDGKIEFQLLDDDGDVFALMQLHPADVPEFISTVVSLSGHDTLGRDFAVTLNNLSK
jgi:hypothetical protein